MTATEFTSAKAKEFTTDFGRSAQAAGLSESEIASLIAQHGFAGELRHRRELSAAWDAAEAIVSSRRTGPAPTERQVDYLLSLGATQEEIMGLSRAEASRRIDELKASRSAGSPAQARAAGRRLGIDGEIWD